MNNQDRLNELCSALNQDGASEEMAFTGEMVAGDVDVLQVTIQDREEFPIYVSIDESQILVITHLWRQSEVKQEKREALLDALLIMNLPMPLSAFSRIGEQYILFGALATSSSVEDIIHEIEVLSDNTLDAVEAVAEFLK